ncbi:hypothetical protein JG687_00012039 [Phytophthora cactorum]|uniref:Uncharacterized protein n=1 Tax=Phytophthora cactorum TaxID=29920 RepID=A0A8T1U870_9STRA|nr:hypothetical protein JG687_00012039 [Phytophthora cactorum]
MQRVHSADDRHSHNRLDSGNRHCLLHPNTPRYHPFRHFLIFLRSKCLVNQHYAKQVLVTTVLRSDYLCVRLMLSLDMFWGLILVAKQFGSERIAGRCPRLFWHG